MLSKISPIISIRKNFCKLIKSIFIFLRYVSPCFGQPKITTKSTKIKTVRAEYFLTNYLGNYMSFTVDRNIVMFIRNVNKTINNN